jgi:hypothetical protein
MKFIKLIAFTVLFSGGVFAQQSIEAKAQEQTSEMSQLLNLDAAQKDRVYILNLKVAEKIEAIENNAELSDTKKEEFIQGNLMDRSRVMRSLLNDEQYAIYEEHYM